MKPKVCGIYRILNKIDDKVYIGSSKNILKRWEDHRYKLKKNKHICKHLQNSWNKYGKYVFKFDILEECEEKKLIEREQHYIDLYKSYDRAKGFNVRKQAESNFSVKHTKKTRRKMSRIVKERYKDPKKHEDLSFAKLNWRKVNEIREKYKSGNFSQYGLAKEYGVSRGTILKLLYNDSWKDENYMFDPLLVNKNKELNQFNKKENNPNAKMTFATAKQIRRKYQIGKVTAQQLGKEYGISDRTVLDIVWNRIWVDSTYRYEKEPDYNLGSKNPMSKLTWEKAEQIREKYNTGGYSQQQLAEEYGVSRTTIQPLVEGKTWKYEKNITD